MISFDSVTKTYKTDFWLPSFYALKDVSFSIRPRKLTGFLGANGAGKTTSLKILMDFVRQDSGIIKFDNELGINRKNIFSNIGYLPERPYFYQSLTGREFLNYMAKLQNVESLKIKKQIDHWSNIFNIHHALDRKIKGYSKGMLQRLGMTSTLLHNPKLIILDEPLSGLDPVGRKEIKDVLVELNNLGHTIFFSTHIVSDVEEICHDVIVLEKGECIYSGEVQKLIEQAGEEVWEIKYKKEDSLLNLYTNAKDKDEKIVNLIAAGASITSLSLKRQSLESVIYNINEEP
jgi:ABC-2 type transport system ATP-binding protein